MERPKYIVVEGPPGSGKSELARILAQRLGARLVLEPDDNPFVHAPAAERARSGFAAQVYFLLRRWQSQAEIVQEDLLARGVVADHLLARDHLYASLLLTRQELALYRRLYELLAPRAVRPDLVVLLQPRPERLRRRKNGDGLDEATLAEIARAYGEFFFEYAKSPLVVVDPGEVDFHDARAQADLLAVLRGHRGGVLHYHPVARAS